MNTATLWSYHEAIAKEKNQKFHQKQDIAKKLKKVSPEELEAQEAEKERHEALKRK